MSEMKSVFDTAITRAVQRTDIVKMILAVWKE